MELTDLIKHNKEKLQSIDCYDYVLNALNEAYKSGKANTKLINKFVLTQEILKEHFQYKDDGFLYWIKRRKTSSGKIGERAGTQDKNSKYRYFRFAGKQCLLHRIIFFYHKGYLPKKIDHIDRDPSNCRIENLREASSSQNSCNKTATGSSKYLGVCKRRNRFQAKINDGTKVHYLGSFKSESKAALTYNKFAVMYHKEFANLNIITLV